MDWANARETGKVPNVAGGNMAGSPAKSSLAKSLARANVPALAPAYSPDGKTLLLAASSRVLQLVDLPAGKEVGLGQGHAEALTAIWSTRSAGMNP